MSIKMKRLAAGLAPLSLLILSLSLTPARAAGPAGSVGKPGAPVELRWLETGTGGRIVVEVTTGVDYDALELELLVPGLQAAPAPVRLDSGDAGAPRRAEWFLADEPASSPRILVIVESSGRRLGRVVAAPSQAGKMPARAAARAPMPKATAEGLIEMRGETRYGNEADAAAD